MIIIQRYTFDKAIEWNGFVEKSKNSTFMHKRDYMDYHADRFVDHSLMFYNNSELVAVLPASLHESELRSHGGLTYGGLIIPYSISIQMVLEIFEKLKDYLKENGFLSLLYKRVPLIYYQYPSDEDLYALFRIGAKLVRRDISTTIYIPNKIKFSDRRKRGVKTAIKQQIIVKQTNDYDTYVQLLTEILSKYHNVKPVHTASELKLLADRLPENIKLFSAFKENRMLAGVLVYVTNRVAHAQYIVNSDEGRKCGALDAVMNYLINEQFTDKEYFDFGISTEESGRYLNEGLVTQKQEFGGRGIVYDFYEIKV